MIARRVACWWSWCRYTTLWYQTPTPTPRRIPKRRTSGVRKLDRRSMRKSQQCQIKTLMRWIESGPRGTPEPRTVGQALAPRLHTAALRRTLPGVGGWSPVRLPARADLESRLSQVIKAVWSLDRCEGCVTISETCFNDVLIEHTTYTSMYLCSCHTVDVAVLRLVRLIFGTVKLIQCNDRCMRDPTAQDHDLGHHR